MSLSVIPLAITMNAGPQIMSALIFAPEYAASRGARLEGILGRVSDAPLRNGNSIELIKNGPDTYDHWLQAIGRAHGIAPLQTHEHAIAMAASGALLGGSLVGARFPRLIAWPLTAVGALFGGLGLLRHSRREVRVLLDFHGFSFTTWLYLRASGSGDLPIRPRTAYRAAITH
jgi:hypothetical protein